TPLTLLAGDGVPDAAGDEVAVGLVALRFDDGDGAGERVLLAEDADLRREGADRPRVGDVKLPGDATTLPILHHPPAQGGDHPEAQEEVLDLPREPLADRGVAELCLAGGEHRRPAVGREEAVEEERDLP